MTVEIEPKYIDPVKLKGARDRHGIVIIELKEKLQKLLKLKANQKSTSKPLILEGKILRIKKAIKQEEAILANLEIEKCQKAAEIHDRRLASRNDNRGAITAGYVSLVQGGSPGSKK